MGRLTIIIYMYPLEFYCMFEILLLILYLDLPLIYSIRHEEIAVNYYTL